MEACESNDWNSNNEKNKMIVSGGITNDGLSKMQNWLMWGLQFESKR